MRHCHTWPCFLFGGLPFFALVADEAQVATRGRGANKRPPLIFLGITKKSQTGLFPNPIPQPKITIVAHVLLVVCFDYCRSDWYIIYFPHFENHKNTQRQFATLGESQKCHQRCLWFVCVLKKVTNKSPIHTTPVHDFWGNHTKNDQRCLWFFVISKQSLSRHVRCPIQNRTNINNEKMSKVTNVTQGAVIERSIPAP